MNKMKNFIRKVCALIVTVAMVVGIIQGLVMPSYAVEATKGKEMVSSALLTSVTLQKLVNGSYTTATEFEANDPFKMIMHFKVPAHTFSESDTLEMYYQLPSALKVQKKETGNVVDDHGNVFGTFVVNTDGKITINFNSNFNIANTYTGKLTFQGKVSDSVGQNGDETINFGNTDSKITIKKNDKGDNTPDDSKDKYDSSIKKEGTVSSDHKSVTYKVTVSTKNGTGEKVKIEDAIERIQNLDAKYDQNSFSLVKKEANGKSSKISFNNDQLTITNDSKPSFTLKDLAALNAGESYELTYKMNLSSDVKNNDKQLLVNGVKSNGHSTSVDTPVSDQEIVKEGKVTGDTIKWVIKVNDPRVDLSTYKLKDNLSEGYYLTEGYKVKDVTDNSEATELESGKAGDTSINIDFSKLSDKKKNHKFEITYWTNTLDPDVIGNPTTIDNVVHLINKNGIVIDEKASIDYSPYSLNKSLTNHTVKDNSLINTWHVDLNLAGHSFDEFTYKDTLQNGVDGNGKDLGADSHYTTAKTLYDELNGKISLIQVVNGNSGSNAQWQTKTYKQNDDYTWTLACYDKNKNPIANSNNTKYVKSFKLTIRPKNANVKPTKMSIDYTTIGDLSSMADKEKRTFKNKGTLETYITDGNRKQISVPDQKKESSYIKSTLIEKQASVSGDNGSYQENLNTNYEDLKTSDHKKVIYYRIIVDVKKTQSGDLTIEDTLPKGLTYKERSLKGGFYYGKWDVRYKNDNTKGYDFSDKAYKPTITTSKNDDGSTKMTITIKDGYEKSDVDDQKIAIDYCAIVSDDTDWNNMKISSKDYVNKATYEHTSTSQKTTVNREVSEIGKGVTQLKDANGKWANQLSYNVPINPSGKDLNSHGDTLTLVDQLNVPNGVSAYLDLNSVKLYSYNWSKENKIGDEIDHSLYSFTYDEKTHKMSLEIPDEMGLVLTYKYNIDPGSVASPNISNNVSLGGRYRASTNNSFKVESASANIASQEVKIKKVDAKDYSKFLPGAIFTVSKWTGNGWEYQKYTTNEKGEISLGDLEPKVLYRVEETTAPSGYKTNSKIYYVMLIDNKDDDASLSDAYETKLYDALDSKVKGDVQGKENITFVGNEGATLLVDDIPSNITVDKSWVDQNGQAISPGEQSIHLNIYRATKVISSVQVNITVKHSTWTETKSLTIDKGTTVTINVSSQWDEHTIKDENGVDHGRTYEIGPFNNNSNVTINSDSYSLNYDYTSPQARIDYDDAIIAPDHQSGITLSKTNDWKETISDLPATDGKGHDYVYYVKEDNVNGYTASYRNNGISTGTIHVINTEDQTKTQLPSTGGNGTGLFYGLGCVLLMISMIYVIFKKKVMR